MRIGLLCSGNLGIRALQSLATGNDSLVFVFTDYKSQEIISYCESNKIQAFIGNPRKGLAQKFINNKDVDVLISINYLFIIEQDLIKHPKILAFNIHGSLLPKYRGRTPHVWSIINNESTTGITAHLIEEGCDTGDILEQIIVPITNEDTGATILKKFEPLYLQLLSTIITDIKNGNIKLKKQDNTKATYFGKRNPEDGRINWDWQKERIQNWVRAQAFPYPGAYTFYNGIKITIDKIGFSDIGFDFSIQNGSIISLTPLVVKTPNGAIQINEIRGEHPKFKLSDILN
jgi:methionyl-tRNA formyltransferase